jgi:hypothetical protein
MMRIVAFCCLVTIASCCFGQSLDSLVTPMRSGVSTPSDDARSIRPRAEIQALTDRMVDRWNAHDIDGYMEQAWKSDEFRIVGLDDEAFTVTGWTHALQDYKQGYTDRTKMGNMRCQVLGIELVTPELALVSNRCIQILNDRARVGISWMVVAKFSDAWKVVSDYSWYHSHTPLQVDPYLLRPWKMVPFGSQDPLSFPAVLRGVFVKADSDRNQTVPISLSITPNGHSRIANCEP